jgi:CheY-like chemotaxis protein
MSMVFVSYSRKDSEFALKLVNDLQSNKVQMWIDQFSIPAGITWDNAIEKALDTATHVLFIASNSSVESKNVRDEIGYALNEGKAIIPIMIEACKLPLPLTRINYIDIRIGYEIALAKLLLQLPKPDTETSHKEAEIADWHTELVSLLDVNLDIANQEIPDLPNPYVLIVEDTVELGEVIEATLGEIGLHAHLATKGAIAVATLLKHKPSLVLLDINLPDSSGWLVLEKLKENYGNSIPVIVMTAYGDHANRLLGKLQGTEYLVKPFTPEEIASRVTKILGLSD